MSLNLFFIERQKYDEDSQASCNEKKLKGRAERAENELKETWVGLV